MKTKVKRLSKRTLAMLLSVLMMVSIVTVGTISASAWWWTNGDYRLIGDFNNWAWDSNYLTLSESSGTYTGTMYLYGSASTSNFKFSFLNRNDSGTRFNPYGDSDYKLTDNTNYGTDGPQNGKCFYLERKTQLGSSASDLYQVDFTIKANQNKPDVKFHKVGKVSAISPSATTKKGSTATNSFETGDTVTIVPSYSGTAIGTISYTYEYKLSTASSYTSLGSTATFTPTTAGTYNVRVKASDNGIKTSGDGTTNGTEARKTETSSAYNITVAAPACTPAIRGTSGTDELADTTINSHQTLQFKVYDPNSHTSSLSITKDGTAQTASTYLSATSNIASGTTVTFTPTADAAATYVITQSCSGGGSDSVTITVTNPDIYFKRGGQTAIQGGQDGDKSTKMTYDSAATTTLGGTAGHAVYSLKDYSFGGTSATYWAIYNGTNNKSYNTAITSSTANAKLGQTGISTVNISSSSKTITPSGTKDHYNLYYDLITDKFYIEYPVAMTTKYVKGPTYNSTNTVNIGTTYIAYNTVFAQPSNPTAPTGYTFETNGWYTNNACTTKASFTSARTANATFYAKMVAKQATVTFDTNGATSNGTQTVSGKATYGVAMPSFTTYTAPTKTGYSLDGWYDASTSGTKYYNADGTSAKSWDKNTTNSTPLYAHWIEVKAGATIKAYTNGSASGTGGTVKVGSSGTAGATATIDNNNTFGIDTASPAIIKASTASGYTFKGWETGGTYGSHVRLYIDSACTTLYDKATYGGTISTVYAKTDGYTANSMTTVNTEIRAMFESAKYTITYSGKYTDNGTTQNAITATQGTFTVTNNSNSGANVASGSTVNYQNKLTVTATPAAGYVVDGIYYKTTSDGTWNKMTTATNTSTGAVYNNNFNVESNWFFEARFKKIYHISLYNTTEEVGGDFRYISGPPMRVTVTPEGGTAVTYTYKKNVAATSEGATRTESGNYNEGDLLTVYAGDTVVLTYAALASSDTITGVFFNNSKRYTCEGQEDNLYKNREYKAAGWGTDGDDSWDYDYMAATTLYANENYYEGSVATTIAGQKANYQAKDGVDNNMHTVTFVAKSDYLNIDLEIATKRQFIFTDETGLDIRSEMMDNYYNPLSEVSASSATTKFGIKLATSDTCSYAWGTGAKVKFYRDAACTNEVTGVFTVASSADSSGYFVISGTMPNYNVYIKPNIVTKYQVSLGTVMLADVSTNNYSYWNQAADVSLNYGGTKYKNEKYDGITAPDNCIKAITKGDTVTFISSNYNDKTQYTFLGWYKGTAEGPDYKNGLLSEKETFNFIPRANTYVYAVGTRDLFINGSKYITGATNDWNRTGSNDPVNFKMEFDPTKGTKGMYYWELDADTLYAAVSSTGYTNGGGVTENGSHWYWNNNTNMGNSWFQIMDSPTGWDRSAVWGANDDSDFKTTETNKIEYGKIRKGTSGNDWKAVEACGYIKFKESDYPGWSAPLRIYVDPTATGVNKGRFTVEPTPTYSNLYVSNGFDVGGTSRNTATTVTVPTGETSFTIKSEGAGWNPDHEGHVQHYIPQKKNAKVRITKTCSANEKIVAFDIYDIDNDTFYSRTDVTASENNYYIDLQCTMQQNLYIVPVVQEKSADLTINFDGTQLNKAQWGEIVTAYAWYSDGSSTHALGAYPGQPMVVSDDGNTWTAAIPSTRTISGTKYTLAGILFTNYVDGNHSWLGCGSVMGTEQNAGTQSISTTGGIITQYNIMKDTDYRKNDTTGEYQYYGTYNKANFKAQTYDYREPVAIYNNAPKGDGVKTTITFAMKDGDSSLISWRHSELTGNNILNLPSGWTPLRWEYLTNSTGKKYSDLNGQPMEGKPTATYYIAAKGQVIYKDDSMTKVYYGGKDSDAPSPAVSYGLSGTSIDFNYAVQWYVYDAQGNYITNVLSSAFADQKDGMSYIAKQLDDLGYAVDGKSVAICYDKPRYMYTDDGGVINSGANFDAYRFEGQWYSTVQTEPVTVSVGVGMMTENGEVIADTNHPGYGDATAAYSTTYGTASYAHSSDGDKSVTVALADASKRLVKLDANATNFVGWYYYDANTNKFTKASYKNATDFYPNFSADVTYYAMYEAKAVYQYNYNGREDAKSYSVDGGDLTDAEMSNGNKVSTERTDFASKAPGEDKISIFKKTIDFNTWTAADNNTPYILQKSIEASVAEYTLTYYYPESKGGNVVDHSITQKYNTTVDLASCNVGNLAPDGKVFMGWYEYYPSKPDDEKYGKLLTTQGNYGFVMTKDQTVAARYGDAAATDTGWKAFIDDSEVNKEMTSDSAGTYYNDTIVRFRNGVNAAESLPNNAEYGVLIINDGKSDLSVTPPVSNREAYANALTNGQKRAIGSGGRTVTKLCKTVSDKPLTYYNRSDFALRSDYVAYNRTNYATYAYVKIGDTYYWSDVAEGTYD